MWYLSEYYYDSLIAIITVIYVSIILTYLPFHLFEYVTNYQILI